MGNAVSNFFEDVTGKSRRRAEEEQALREEEQALREEEQALREGNYYSRIDDVLSSSEGNFSDDDFKALRGREYHPFYEDIIEHAKNDELLPACESGRSEFDPKSDASSLQPYSTESATNRTRRRRLHEITIDGTQHSTAQVAHLIPYATSCSDAYLAIAEAATGVIFTDEQATKRQRVLVHGQYEITGENKKERKHGSGLKHCRTNMARIVGQKENLDNKPNMLILPIKSHQDTLDYKGGPYEVLVLCESPGIYVDSLLLGRYETCNPDEIETAVETLSKFVKGVAAASLQLPVEVVSKVKPKHEKDALEKVHLQLQRTKAVQLPKVKTELEKQRVLKLSFSHVLKDSHHETDPFLLFTKMAVVWSHRNGQKLLPGCPFPPNHCAECAANGFLECDCESFDPCCPVPTEIYVEDVEV